MGCVHKKLDEADGRFHHHKWCRPCAEKKAGPKPRKRWSVGFLAVDREGEPGRVIDVKLKLYGIATEQPSWCEELTVRTTDGTANGASTFWERLIVDPAWSTEDRSEGNG